MDDDRTSLEDIEALVFGMDPAEWAALLHQKLDGANQRLEAALRHEADPRRDRSDHLDEHAKTQIRESAVVYLGTIFELLKVMPIFQSAPRPLNGLHQILTSLMSFEQGSAPEWLKAKSTHIHNKATREVAEWLPIITSVALLDELSPAYSSRSQVLDTIATRTERRKGTVTDWYYKLYHPVEDSYFAARAAIQTEVRTLKAVMALADDEERARWVNRRIDQLLPPQ